MGAAIVQTIWLTVLTWLPIIALFYLPNTIWGVIVKILAGIWIVSAILQLNFGATAKAIPFASVGVTLNALWFALLNFAFPDWIKSILVLLIVIGMGTSIKLLANEEKI